MGKNQLTAGFIRVDITPKNGGIPLAGYGATHLRLAGEVLNPIYINATALGQDGKPVFVHLVADLIRVDVELVKRIKEAASEKTGLAPEAIFVSSTHTHSAPDVSSTLPSISIYCDYLTERAAFAAERAVADLKPAKIFYGKTEVEANGSYFNFGRHYRMTERGHENDENPELFPVGDQYGLHYSRQPEKYVYYCHDTEADHEMQMIRFARENAPDILWVNWTAHATITGGTKSPLLSSDYPGPFREKLEALLGDCCSVFLQGGAGNVNPCTRIPRESIPGITDPKASDHRAYGSVLAAFAEKLYREGLKESESDEVRLQTVIMTGRCDHSMDRFTQEAQTVKTVFLQEGDSDHVHALCDQFGFNSPYQCNAILSKAKRGETRNYPLSAVRIGDAALAATPFESFSATGKFVKTHSPFALTFFHGYCNGFEKYLPSADCYENTYERNVTIFEPGTAEITGDKLVEMLNELK